MMSTDEKHGTGKKKDSGLGYGYGYGYGYNGLLILVYDMYLQMIMTEMIIKLITIMMIKRVIAKKS